MSRRLQQNVHLRLKLIPGEKKERKEKGKNKEMETLHTDMLQRRETEEKLRKV